MTSTRCAACPVRKEIPCPAIAGIHRPAVARLCELNAGEVEGQDADIWRAETVKMAEGDILTAERWKRRLIRPWKGPKIRVGLGTPGLMIGGAERVLLDQARALHTAPFELVGIACLKPEKTEHPEMIRRAREFAPVLFGEQGFAELGRSIDILVEWGVPDVFRLIGEDAGCRVAMLSQNAAECKWTAASLKDAGAATTCVAVSESAAKAFPRSDWERVKIVYNTAPEPRPKLSRTDQRRAWGIPEGKKVVGLVARLTRQKYPQAIAKAVRHLPDEWVGVLVGPWNHDGHEIKTAIAAEGVSDRLYLPGETLDPASAINALDVHLCDTDYEGLSIAQIETWLLGVPLIASKVGYLEKFPGLARIVPVRADGPTLAQAILDDEREDASRSERIASALNHAKVMLGFDRFAREWQSLVFETMEATKSGQEGTPDPSPFVGSAGPPPLRVRAMSLAGEMVRWAWAGFPLAGKVLKARRLAICRGCKHYVPNNPLRMCNACGCTAVKPDIATSKCPLGKWPAVA